MSQDIKESRKQAHLHAVSKPARASTIRGADPNAKSRVLDPGPSPLSPAFPAENLSPVAQEFVAKVRGETMHVAFELPAATYAIVHAYAEAEKITVAEIFQHYAQDLEAAHKLQALGSSPTDEPPAP
jgi:hypothetical protein